MRAAIITITYKAWFCFVLFCICLVNFVVLTNVYLRVCLCILFFKHYDFICFFFFQPLSIYGDQLVENPKFRNELTGEFSYQVLEQKLRKQQRESEEDSKWLAESETNLVSYITN